MSYSTSSKSRLYTLMWLIGGLLIGSMLTSFYTTSRLSYSINTSELFPSLPSANSSQLQPTQLSNQCTPCQSSPALCERYGSTSIRKSRIYEGSGLAVQRVMKKAVEGKGLRIGVMGGSITAGHGCPGSVENVWHNSLKRWAEDKFGGWEKVQKYVGAKPGLGTDFFAYCHGSVLPSDMDLIVVETSVNDWEWNRQAHSDFEFLVRSLLARPSPPAIIALHSFSLYRLMTGGDAQLSLANYYDFPIVGTRPVVLPAILANSDARAEYFAAVDWGDHVDGGHPNCNGHDLMADLLISYLEEQICLAEHPELSIPPPEDSSYRISFSTTADLLPRIPMHDSYSIDHIEPTADPTCLSLDHEFSPPIEPKETSGFKLWTMPGSNGEKKFIRGENPGDSITFSIDLERGSESSLFLYRFVSPKWDLGDVKCWIDDDARNATVIAGYWEEQYSIGKTARIEVPNDLTPGLHDVSCEILATTSHPLATAHNVMIIAVIAG